MLSNDVIRRLRYALDVRNREVAEICAKGGSEVSEADVRTFLLREHEEGYAECGDEVLTGFLDGLIIHLRGARDSEAGQPALERIVASTNNRILRKLRIAFDLKDEGMLELLTLGGFVMSKSELSALFRKENHKHYRECGDQVLRYFIIGLTKERRPDAAPEEDPPEPASETAAVE